MIAVKRIVTIQNPRELVLNDLPFRVGQQIEVVLLAEESTANATLSGLQTLFRETQALPQVRAITEEEIAAEVEAYRAERREGLN